MKIRTGLRVAEHLAFAGLYIGTHLPGKYSALRVNGTTSFIILRKLHVLHGWTQG